MPADSNRHWFVLAEWSPIAFLVAGGCFVIFAGYWGAFAFTTLDSEAVQNVVGPAGWTAAFVGLLGLHLRLVNRAGRISTVASLFAVLGIIGATITTAGNFLELLAVVQSAPAWFDALQLLMLVGIVPGFLTFAFATLRTSSTSRLVGVLLIAPAGIFAINIVRVATLGSTTPSWAPFLLGAGQAIALLAIGYALRREPLAYQRTEPIATPTGE